MCSDLCSILFCNNAKQTAGSFTLFVFLLSCDCYCFCGSSLRCRGLVYSEFVVFPDHTYLLFHTIFLLPLILHKMKRPCVDPEGAGGMCFLAILVGIP